VVMTKHGARGEDWDIGFSVSLTSLKREFSLVKCSIFIVNEKLFTRSLVAESTIYGLTPSVHQLAIVCELAFSLCRLHVCV
jgi:hypothetical protein